MQGTLNPPTLSTEFCPFSILNMETGTLYSFKINAAIFIKFGTYVSITSW